MNSIMLLAHNDDYQTVPMLRSKTMYALADVENMGTLMPEGYMRPHSGVGTFFVDADEFDLLMAKCLRINAEPWMTYVMDKKAPVDMSAIQMTAAATLRAIRSEGVGAIDLNSLGNPSEVSGEHLAMLLSCLSSWQPTVSGWNQAIAIAKEALTNEGKDYEDALFGII